MLYSDSLSLTVDVNEYVRSKNIHLEWRKYEQDDKLSAPAMKRIAILKSFGLSTGASNYM